MPTSIDQLQTDIDNFGKKLNELKGNISLSATEIQEKAENMKQQAEPIRQSIQQARENAKEQAQKEKVDSLSKTFDEIMSEIIKLNDSILNSGNSPELLGTAAESISATTVEDQDEEKGFSIKEWFGKQWEKIKEDPGTYIIGAVGVSAVGYIAKKTYDGIRGAYKRIRKKIGLDKAEPTTNNTSNNNTDKKTSRWKKGLARAGGITATILGGTAIYKYWPSLKTRFKDFFSEGLTMEQSIVSATAEVRSGQIDESPFLYNFEDGIQYDEQKRTIKSYGRETKIDPVKKKLIGLDNVVFENYKELIHAANITNCLKSNFHNCCASETPFAKTQGGGGDLQVTLADGSNPEVLSASDSNVRAWIGGIGGGVVGGLLGGYCGKARGSVLGTIGGVTAGVSGGAYLDNNSSMGHTVSTIASGENFDKFIVYLNQQKAADGKSLRLHQGSESISTETPLQNIGQTVLDEIRGTYSENGDSPNRNLDIKQDEENPSRFYIESYNEKVSLTIEGLTLTPDNKIDYNKITSIKLGKYKETDRGEGLELDFPHTVDGLEEAIKVANLTNKIRKDFHDKGGVQHPFGVKLYGTICHLQIDTNERTRRGRNVLTKDTLKNKFPTLWEDVSKQIEQRDQKKLRDQAFNNKDQMQCESKYIRYLHQMREKKGNVSYWRNKSKD